METARAADGFADIPDIERENGISEHCRELGGLSPAEIAALECLLPVGMGHRHAREVRPTPNFREHALGTLAGRGNLLRRRAVANRDQNVSNPVPMTVRIRSAALHHRKVVVDVALRDVDLVLDPKPAHLGDHDLFANLLAKFREVVAVAFHRVPEFP